MAFNSTIQFSNLVNTLSDYNVPLNITNLLRGYEEYISRSELESHFSTPMFWIGIYIALASVVCILAMVADLLHGFRSRKLWFPCKYFKYNAAFLTAISIAMKLPVDLTGSMMGQVDRTTKLGSMAFMCTMMANLLPCLATMGNNELLSNITALCVLVITLVVNICIQIQTGVVSTYIYFACKYATRCPPQNSPIMDTSPLINNIASIYVSFLVVLLILHISSSVAILKTKKIIESKYQQGRDIASKEIQPSSGKILTFEKLEKYVSNHWIMAGSGSPQFITACFPTTSASGVICLSVTILHTYTMFLTSHAILQKDYDSDYGSSMMVILIVQFIGVLIGTIAPLFRCFSTLSFKVSSKIISNHLQVFKVERYWTQKLYNWKHACIRLPFLSPNLEVVIETLKRIIFNICIGLQNGVVVVCKVITLIPFLFVICFFYCFHCIKWLLKTTFSSLRKKFEKWERNNGKSETLEGNNGLRTYVMQLQDEEELGERTLKGLSKSVSQLIQKGAKSQPSKLMELILGKSTSGFEGVRKFDQTEQDVPSKYCWRLAVVTLTTIVISLPNIEPEEVDSLLENVRAGLEYVIVVEKILNAKNDHLSFQKAAATLWQEIRFDKKWLGYEFQNPAFKEYTTRPIVEWFKDKANNIVCLEDKGKDNIGGKNVDSIHKSICANSMYGITETILLNCPANIDATVSQKELFDSLSSMIADIIAACLTNLPEAIIMKCHTSVIEEREESVKDAAQLLGETKNLITALRDHDIPNINPCDLPFIEKWRAYLGNP